MLRLYDVEAGLLQPVRGKRRGELRVLILGSAAGRRAHLADLRSYLLPDLIRRWAERRGLYVFTCELSVTAGERTLEAQRAEHAALNIHPPDRTSESPEPQAAPAGPAALEQPGGDGPPFDIATGNGDHSPLPDGLAAHRAASTGPVTFEGHDVAGLAEAAAAAAGAVPAPAGNASPDGNTSPGGTACPAGARGLSGINATDGTAGTEVPDDTDAADAADGADGLVWLSDVTGLGLDPLALRLAFLRHHYREQADLTWDALVAADRALRRWREQVAGWATEPSAALVRSYADAVTGAFEDDLDTPAALHHLQALEADSAVPPGAKFETFAHLDLLFGLDLAREIGRY